MQYTPFQQVGALLLAPEESVWFERALMIFEIAVKKKTKQTIAHYYLQLDCVITYLINYVILILHVYVMSEGGE